MKKLLLITTACVALFAPPAFAAEKVAEVGPWLIGKEEGLGAGACFAHISYKQSGTRFYIGQARDPNNHDVTAWSLVFRNDKWNLLAKGAEASIEIVDANNKHKKWNLTVTMEKEGHGFFVWVKKELIDSMTLDKNGGGFKLIVNKHEVGNFSLDQSAAAIRAVVNCLQNYSPPATAKKEEKKDENRESSGTGFFVAPGFVLTNHHVIDECRSMWVKYPQYRKVEAYVNSRDATNDLALLSTKLPNDDVAKFSLGPRLGESAYAFGFPLAPFLSKEGNFTIGNVSALTGGNDDSRYLQISTPIQQGNSGGPLLNDAGAVIGVTSEKLNAARMQDYYGDIPQNVNFAIQSAIVVNFLTSKGLTPKIATDQARLEPFYIADAAKKFTVQVLCIGEGHEKASG